MRGYVKNQSVYVTKLKKMCKDYLVNRARVELEYSGLDVRDVGTLFRAKYVGD